MRKLVFAILLLFIYALGHAQDDVQQPPARLLTKFPFKMYSGGVMVLQARLGEIPDTLNFILDTGSGGISLDSTSCADLNLKPVPTDTSITGIAGIHKVPFLFDQTLHMEGLDVNHLNFHVNDYEVLTSVYGEKVDGVIGYSFFSRYIVSIDFDSLQIAVYSPGAIKYPEHGTTLTPAFTALPIQFIHFKDRKRFSFNFYMDSGAGLNFLLNEKLVRDSSVLLRRRKPVVTQAEGIGGILKMRLTVIKQVKLGPYVFYNVPTYLYSDSFNVTSYPFVGGLLGNDLMRRFNMIYNYGKHEIFLKPNAHYRDSFDYVYTGLGIYFERGKVVVEDVIEGSPAADAGIKAGDIIVAVGNNFSNNIMTYKNILQTAHEKIKIILMRKDKPMMVTLKTVTIF